MQEDKTLEHYKGLAYRYLAIRSRSRKEMAAYISRKGADEGIAAIVIKALEDYGYIDDRKFAVSYARYLVESRGLSRYALRVELGKKGVSPGDIDLALSGLAEEGGLEDELAVALRMAGKKNASLRGVDKDKARRRLVDFLRRRGFSFDVIGRVVKDTF